MISGHEMPPQAIRHRCQGPLWRPPRAGGRGSSHSDALEIARRPHGQAVATRRLGERGEVRRRELRELDGDAHRPEVMDLRAVGGVVVDHDEHVELQPAERLQVGQRHQQAAVADRADREAVGVRDRRADRVAEREPDALEGLREDEALRVRDLQVHRRVAHERAGVHDDGALARQQVVEGDAQRARVEPVAALLVGLVAPAPGRDLGGERDAAPRSLVGAAAGVAERREQRLGGGAGVADDAEVDGPVRADRLEVAVDLDDASCRGPISAPWRVVHWFSAAPNAMTRSDSFSSRWASRRGEAAGDAEVERVAGEQAVGDGGGRQHGAEPLAERAQRGPGAGQDRAAAGDDRGPLARVRARRPRR